MQQAFWGFLRVHAPLKYCELFLERAGVVPKKYVKTTKAPFRKFRQIVNAIYSACLKKFQRFARGTLWRSNIQRRHFDLKGIFILMMCTLFSRLTCHRDSQNPPGAKQIGADSRFKGFYKGGTWAQRLWRRIVDVCFSVYASKSPLFAVTLQFRRLPCIRFAFSLQRPYCLALLRNNHQT